MSHTLFSEEKSAEDFLPDTKVPTPPPPEPESDEGEPEDFGVTPSDKEVEQTGSQMFVDDAPKLLDSVDAKDWRKRNNKREVGQRGKDKAPRKKAPLSEKRLASLAKAREASKAKAAARRAEKMKESGKKLPEKVELVVEEKPTNTTNPKRGTYVDLTNTTLVEKNVQNGVSGVSVQKEAVPEPPPSPPKLTRQKAERSEVQSPVAAKRQYSMEEFEAFAKMFGSRQAAEQLPQQPIVEQPPPRRRQTAGEAMEHRSRRDARSLKPPPKRQPKNQQPLQATDVQKPYNAWDDYFL